MYNVMVWVRSEDFKGRFFKNLSDDEHVITLNYLRMQIENSLRIGWKPEQIKIFTNFDFNYLGISTIRHERIQKHSSWMNKWTAVQQLLDLDKTQDIFFHDIDAMQTEWCDIPDSVTGVAFSLSDVDKKKWNGGVCFARVEIFQWLLRRFIQRMDDYASVLDNSKTDEDIWGELSRRRRLRSHFSILPKMYNLAEGRGWRRSLEECEGIIKILHIKPHLFNRHWHRFRDIDGKKKSMAAKLTPPVLRDMYIKYDLWHSENDKF